jgi:hypothetical protein
MERFGGGARPTRAHACPTRRATVSGTPPTRSSIAMKKLNLDLDQLVVESFSTAAARRAGGTVRGNDLSDTTCYQRICDCPTGFTCLTDCNQYSCAGTCGDSCDNICPSGRSCDNPPTCFDTCGYDTCGCL